MGSHRDDVPEANVTQKGPSSLVVRRVESRDEVALGGLFERLRDDRPTARYFHPHPLDNEAAARVAHHHGQDVYLGCFHGAELAGYAMLRGWDDGFDVPSFGVVVDPSWRRCGIGAMLLKACVDIARERGAVWLRLKVYPENTPAVHWYLSEGFQTKLTDHDGQLVMLRELGPS